MMKKLDRKELILLLKSVSVPLELCEKFTKAGYMEFTGNQWNIDWGWKDDFIKTQTDKEIYSNYQYLKNLK